MRGVGRDRSPSAMAFVRIFASRRTEGDGGSSRSVVIEARDRPGRALGYVDITDLFKARGDARPPLSGAGHTTRPRSSPSSRVEPIALGFVCLLDLGEVRFVQR